MELPARTGREVFDVGRVGEAAAVGLAERDVSCYSLLPIQFAPPAGSQTDGKP
jgi:hypothetical protein